MSNFSKRAVRWAAPVTLVGALGLAACGDNGDSEAIRVATPSGVNGSDQHLNNQAERLEAAWAARASEQHLGSRTPSASVPFNRAEDLAKRAILLAEAERYVESQESRAEANSSVRAGQMAEAERYVESLESRAEANSNGDDPYENEFVPGSRHMPTR